MLVADLIAPNESEMDFDRFLMNFKVESTVFRTNERDRKIKIIAGV